MKYLNLVILISLSLFVMACDRNCYQNTYADSIDLDEWNSATMRVMTEELHLDSVLSNYWRKENPPMLSIDYKPINNFREEIQSFLSIRKKMLSALNNESLLLLKGPFYIIEDQCYTHAGFTRSFTIISEDNQKYYYVYNSDKDYFIKKEIKDKHIHVDQQPFYHSMIDEMGVMTGMHIVTSIHWETDNRISYQILEVVVW